MEEESTECSLLYRIMRVLKKRRRILTEPGPLPFVKGDKEGFKKGGQSVIDVWSDVK